MMKINRKGSASWSGGMKDGKGTISTESGAMNAHPYGFAMRFEGVKGTNPEELIGAAHAGCFTMALSNILGQANLTATKMDTTATVTLEQSGGGFAITAIALKLEAAVPGATQEQFAELAKKAKENCPVSKLMKADITLDAKLV
jgi:osmotically inducible protein OsmC